MASGLARFGAGLVAATAWVGLAVQLRASVGQTGDLATALWVMLRYFTVLTNLLVAIAFTLVMLGRQLKPFLLGGAVLAILLVGVIYATLLTGLLELSGGALLADFLLHKITPVLVLLWWVLFAAKGQLRWRDPVGWAIYPLAYLPYALVRGQAEGVYAYPFINVAKLGWSAVMVNSVAIAVGFLIAGWVLLAIDRALASRH